MVFIRSQFKAKAEIEVHSKRYLLMRWLTFAGDFGWADQAKRQDFNHMPAAQWVVKKNGVSTTSAVTIKNREFNDWGADASAEKVFCLRLQPNSMRWKVAVMSFISMEQCPIH